MCVLTYLPTGNNGFIVTSNRDESINREIAIPPKKLNINGKNIICPIDPISKGTWLAYTKDYTLVLLNGGYIKHLPKPPYRQSRGKIILDFINFSSPDQFLEQFLFENIEPFTLIIFNNHNRSDITEIIWCQEKKYINKFDGSIAQIWSSATLYNPPAIQKRKTWYFDYLQTGKFENSTDNLLLFHKTGGGWDEHNSINLKREGDIQTVSITQIDINHDLNTIYYHDLRADFEKRFYLM